MGSVPGEGPWGGQDEPEPGWDGAPGATGATKEGSTEPGTEDWPEDTGCLGVVEGWGSEDVAAGAPPGEVSGVCSEVLAAGASPVEVAQSHFES